MVRSLVARKAASRQLGPRFGPASVIVPLVATSPALGGLLGIVALREGVTSRQLAGIALGACAAVLLSTVA